MCSKESEFGSETRSYPLENKTKGDGFSLFLCTVPGTQVPWAIMITERAGGAAPPGASACCLAGRRDGGRDDICHSLSEVLSAFVPP